MKNTILPAASSFAGTYMRVKGPVPMHPYEMVAIEMNAGIWGMLEVPVRAERAEIMERPTIKPAAF